MPIIGEGYHGQVYLHITSEWQQVLRPNEITTAFFGRSSVRHGDPLGPATHNCNVKIYETVGAHSLCDCGECGTEIALNLDGSMSVKQQSNDEQTQLALRMIFV